MKQKLKCEKGITNADIVIAVILVTLFIGLLATMTNMIQRDAKKTQREEQAMSYAIELIELAKSQDFSVYPKLGSQKIQDVEELQDGYIVDKNHNTPTPFYKTITVQDISEFSAHIDKQPEIMKKITVTISYQQDNEEKNVTLTTYVTKEG